MPEKELRDIFNKNYINIVQKISGVKLYSLEDSPNPSLEQNTVVKNIEKCNNCSIIQDS